MLVVVHGNVVFYFFTLDSLTIVGKEDTEKLRRDDKYVKILLCIIV